MNRGTKELVVGVIGVTALVLFLIGLFTDAYDTMVGLVIAIGLWALSGLLARYWNVPKWNARRQ